MRKVLFSLLMLLIAIITSCRTGYFPRSYQYVLTIECDTCDDADIIRMISEGERKSIILMNDSILCYSKRYGGLASATYVRYKMVGNQLVTDSVDIYGYYNDKISNMHFSCSKDSLVNAETGERYFTERYHN